MSKQRICFVLGAGASFPYGLPLGSQLSHDIIGLEETLELRVAAGLNDIPSPHVQSKFSQFKDAFRFSAKTSIDGFLARNPRYSDIGKIAIAACILKREIRENLFANRGGNEDWYQYFWDRISVDDWDDFDPSHISIVTFNYDRSLEKFLTTAAIYTYNKSVDEVAEKLSKIKIIHVYGSLGPKWEWEEGYLEYGGALTSGAIQKAADGIQVIPEERGDSDQFILAKNLLLHANKIAFMGFGFDSINMQRLDVKNTCKADCMTSEGNSLRPIYFTALNLEDEEISRIVRAFDSSLNRLFNYESKSPFLRVSCKSFLRKAPILE